MTIQELPPRQKSVRLQNRNKQRDNLLRFQQFKSKSKIINNINELLPGLNDISDAFEALPVDIIKYFTLFREIDAKCINSIPTINGDIKDYIENLHKDKQDEDKQVEKLEKIKDLVSEIIPCLEEKMHVTSVAEDSIKKHLFRINNDYKLIINNNEIPESIRIGPLNHPAMIIDANAEFNPNRSAQSSRLETRREALAAKKQVNGKDEDSGNNSAPPKKEQTPVEKKKRARKEIKEVPQHQPQPITEDSRPSTPVPKKKLKKPEDSSEPTYCYCNQVSFGEMVGCDGDDCKREWFHLPCIGFKNPPKGKWYCDDCLAKRKIKRV